MTEPEDDHLLTTTGHSAIGTGRPYGLRGLSSRTIGASHAYTHLNRLYQTVLQDKFQGQALGFRQQDATGEQKPLPLGVARTYKDCTGRAGQTPESQSSAIAKALGYPKLERCSTADE